MHFTAFRKQCKKSPLCKNWTQSDQSQLAFQTFFNQWTLTDLRNINYGRMDTNKDFTTPPRVVSLYSVPSLLLKMPANLNELFICCYRFCYISWVTEEVLTDHVHIDWVKTSIVMSCLRLNGLPSTWLVLISGGNTLPGWVIIIE